jgi:hypothetical protein
MKQAFPELPEWVFDLDEISAGVYEVLGTYRAGHRIQAKGSDPDRLVQECRATAVRILQEVKLHRN